MSINSIALALSKIDPGKYQSITVDDQQHIQVVELWHGNVLYALGYRTEISELSKCLMGRVTAFSENTSLTRDQKLDALEVTRLFSKILKDNNFTRPSGNKKCLEKLKEVKAALKASLTREMPPLTAETLETSFNHLSSKMTNRDKIVQNFYLKQNERSKKVIQDYKTIEMQTRNLNPSPANEETIVYYEQDLNSGEPFLLKRTFQAYRLDPSQKFMLHATNPSRVIPMAEQFKKNSSAQPHLCVSLIDSRVGFYGFQYPDRAALILAVDPRQIVLTSPIDIYSPTFDDGEEMNEFYHRQAKLLTITGRINQIHKSSGIEDAYQRYRTQAKAIEEKVYETRGWEKWNCDEESQAHNEKEKYYQDEILKLISVESQDRTVQALKDSIRDRLDFEKNHTVTQLLQLIKYYELNPEKNNSREEFMKLFQYSGSGVVEELQKYALTLLQIRYSSKYLNPIESPEELLAHTRTAKFHRRPYNEINVSLDTAGTRPTEVKGLLLTRAAIMRQGGRKDVGKFTKLIQFAMTNNLPIYILDSLPKAKL